MMYPPSYAMDATAGSGGPSTVLPQIVTGSPASILSHVSELLQKAQQFASLIEEFKKAEQQLTQVWSGHAADSAVKKIEDSLSSFTEIVNVINRGAQLLQQSATMITTAQTGYSSVVGSVNPTVASLMSNPYTYSAAVALSTSASSALRGFITSVAALLKTLGAVNLASELSTVAQIIQELEQLFNNKGTGAAGGASTGAAGSPVTAPVAPASAASAAGLQGLANPGATAAPAAAVSGAPTTLQNGEQGLLHTPDGKLYTADGQPLLTANGTPAYQNYQPAALSGLPNSGVPAPGVPAAGLHTATPIAAPGSGDLAGAAAGGSTAGVPAAGVPTHAPVHIPPVNMPNLSTAGLATGLNGAGLNGAGLGAGFDGAGLNGAGLGTSGTDSWIPVDPSQHAADLSGAGMAATPGVSATDPTGGLAAGAGVDPSAVGGSVAHPMDIGQSGAVGGTALPMHTGDLGASGSLGATGHPGDLGATGHVGDAGSSPAPVPSGHSGEEVTVTTSHAGTTTTVEVPLDGHTEVTVDAEGTVKVG